MKLEYLSVWSDVSGGVNGWNVDLSYGEHFQIWACVLSEDKHKMPQHDAN